MQSSDKTVIPRDLVAFSELGRVLDLAFYLLQLTGQRANADDGLELIAKCFGVDIHGITGDDFVLLQFMYALRHTG